MKRATVGHAPAGAGRVNWRSTVIVKGSTLGGRSEWIAPGLAAYIIGAEWFTASISFANPAETVGRRLSNTIAGIPPARVPGFFVGQCIGAVLTVGATMLLRPWQSHSLPERGQFSIIVRGRISVGVDSVSVTHEEGHQAPSTLLWRSCPPESPRALGTMGAGNGFGAAVPSSLGMPSDSSRDLDTSPVAS
ncbi:MAG: aquaporin [Actinobacteria bacterium]|nr:aquaporin [Actinomycetota bacterium]